MCARQQCCVGAWQASRSASSPRRMALTACTDSGAGFLLSHGVVEEVFAELANGLTAKRAKCLPVKRVEQQSADIVLVGIQDRPIDELGQGHIGEDALGGNALAFRAGRQPGELVA